MSLYEKEKDRYVIDTSSLVLIDTLEESKNIWSCIFALIDDGMA